MRVALFLLNFYKFTQYIYIVGRFSSLILFLLLFLFRSSFVPSNISSCLHFLLSVKISYYLLSEREDL